MKKILLLAILFCCGCTFGSKSEQNKFEYINDSYIEDIPEKALYFISNLDNDMVMLNYKEIENYNNMVKKSTNELYNLDDITSLTKMEILDYINIYDIFSLKYDEKEILPLDVDSILENRDISGITDKSSLKRGIIIKRSNLRAFPTEKHFYDSIEKRTDVIQETELHINTPVIIIHESKDKKWSFVISPTYVGWVMTDNIAYAKEEDFNYFINNPSFGIITTSFLEVNDTFLDMGVKLPYIKADENGYLFSLPIKKGNNYVDKKIITISRDKAHIGYLAYTKRNVYIEAFKYDKVNYSWGGMDYGVDCSSYISNIYKTFGFVFPRNTSSQSGSAPRKIDVRDFSFDKKKEILNSNYPSLLFEDGHVMMYLGTLNDRYYIIHASGKEGMVLMEEINDYHLSKINKIVLVY